MGEIVAEAGRAATAVAPGAPPTPSSPSPAATPAPAHRLGVTALILLGLTLAGAAWRLAALVFNIWPHGDVVLDAAIAVSIARDGRLLVPMVDVRYYPIDQFGFGYPPDQHPPLWPLLGALLVPVLGSGYAALKVVSLLVGIALVPLTYAALRIRVGHGPALLAAALAAGSYPLADFSGNGSLWVLLVAWYLAWLWALPGGAHLESGRRWALVGLIMGLGYLTNYPAVTLVGALVVTHVLWSGRAALRPTALAGPAVALGVMLLTISPWLAFTWATFGSPVWSQPFQRTLAGGSRQVEYVIVGDEVIKRNLPPSPDSLAGLRERAVDLYGNVGFTARQLLILTPVLSGLFLAGLATVGVGWWSTGRRGGWAHRTDDSAVSGAALRPLLPLVALTLVHLALILWWPTTKFRYLIPLLPLVFAVGAWFVWQLRPTSLRRPLVAVTLGLCLFTNLWTMLAIPSRTYYYNGGLVADNFGQQGETLWVQDTRRLRAAADAIVARGPGVMLGDHILAPFTGQPLVVNSTAYPPEVIDLLVRKYGIRYVVAERAHQDRYAFLNPGVLWSDDRLVVLELPGSAV
ncbi:MAG: glycosyltransferase family 39 protein [Chloroflexota bacterium]|nr:glycosyltransferase family 39 protein [Chloroflexota bacterium]